MGSRQELIRLPIKFGGNFVKNTCTLLLAALCGFSGNLVAQTPRQHLTGHVTREMLNSPVVRRVPSTTQLTLSVGLAINDVDALVNAANQIADPKSPSYRKYLTPEQFADQFGATAADYQTLLDWARSNHLNGIAHRNRFVVDVTGSVADIEAALDIHLNYHQRADGSEFFAPDAEPSVKLELPVEHISGLENFVAPQSAGGSGSGGTYQGTDFRNAYAPNMALTGAGQLVGIFMLDGFAQSDINGYATLTSQSFKTVQVVPSSATLTPGTEGTLDVESILAMAPAAQVVAFVGSSNRTQILTNMTDRDDIIKQFSSSWFWYNGTTTDTENLMLQLATQGQSFFQATGDGGAYQIGVFPTYVSGSLDCRQFPSITMVGGTSLNMAKSGASYGTLETAWSGSSGGIESSVSIPSYQWSIAGHNGASASNRNVPDVSAQAAEGNIYFKGKVEYVAGTSEATPLWAGFMALTNELAANYFGSSTSVGFANPALYSIAATSAYATSFHDVLTGCTPDKSGNSYCAGTGYDLATGLGSPQHGLIYELSGVSSYPLYCKGPLVSTGSSTPFKWASQGAGAASPGAGECAWADRAPEGTEIGSGGGNVISGNLNQVANLAAGKYAEIGVYNDPTGHHMVVTQIVGPCDSAVFFQPYLYLDAIVRSRWLTRTRKTFFGTSFRVRFSAPQGATSVLWDGRESRRMALAKEFTVTIEDKPGALGKCFLALAARGINVLAFQSYVEDGESLARLLVDDPAGAKAVLGSLRMIFEETDVAVVRLPHRPGELGRAASLLGEKQVNIDYSYCGLEPGSALALVVFGVDNLRASVAVLDELAANRAAD